MLTRIHKLNIIALAVCFCFCASTARAVLTTSQSASAPTSNVVISQTASTHSTPWRTQSGLRQAGQTFLVGAGGFVLDKITVNINSIQNADLNGDAFTLAINTYSNGTDFTPDSTVVTEAGTLPASMFAEFGSGDTYLTFDITDLALTGGQQYGFFLDPTGFSNSANFLLEAQGNSGYAAGIGVEEGPAEMTIFDGGFQPADMEFYLQAAAVNVVPEPSALVLAALGLFGLLGFRRRRNR